VEVAPSVSKNGMQRIADFVLVPAELDSLEEFVERAKAAGARSTTAAISRRRPV
jgi:hypothetical protein